ncbi:hypothetical protein MMC18_001295 [Xylographa bjoerkii]|nr:hypothetical protein [Xylographa bjoerkii]
MFLSFAKASASHIAAGARSDMSQLANDVEATAASANREPPRFLPLKLDVRDRGSVEEAVATVEKEFGHCDMLVNNAGTFGDLCPNCEVRSRRWWQVLDVNVRGPYLVSRAFLPVLLKSPTAYIIHVTSVASHLLNP